MVAGFADRLAGLKAKQETITAEKAGAEALAHARRERETKQNELQERRARIAEEFEAAQKEAQEGEQAVAEVDAFITEQGDALDAEVKAEVEALKAEAIQARQKFEELQSRIQAIDAELGALENAPEKVAVEAPVEAAQVSVETPQEATVEAMSTAPQEVHKEDNMVVGAESLLSGEKVSGYFQKKFQEDGTNAYADIVGQLRSSVGHLSQGAIEELKTIQAQAAEKAKEIPELKKRADELADQLSQAETYLALRTPENMQKKMQELLAALQDQSFEKTKERDAAGQDLLKMADVFKNDPAASKLVFETLGTGLIDVVKSERDERQTRYDGVRVPRGLPEKIISPLDAYSSGYITGLLGQMENATPEIANEYHKFILDSVKEKFKGTTPKEIRNGLYTRGSNEIIYASLNPLLRRMALGEAIPDDVKASLKGVLPVLESSDGVVDKVDPNGSRFVTPERVTKQVKNADADELKKRGLSVEEAVAGIQKQLAALKEAA